MADTTLISWADMTFNPWIGCTRLSPACDGCYAAQLMDVRLGRVMWGGPGQGAGTRARTSDANWRKPLIWNRKAAEAGTRPFVFCASLADVFDNQVPFIWQRDLFFLIRETPNLIWLLLTKRPQNIIPISRSCGGLPANAAIGTTVEDQTRFDLNVPALRGAKHELKPAFAFLSCEPLLGPLTGSLDEIDWLIAGGETDQGKHAARPSEADWFRSLRDRCAAYGVPFHFKQWGEFAPTSDANGPYMARFGKDRTGRAIDGIEHNGFPPIRKIAA